MWGAVLPAGGGQPMPGGMHTLLPTPHFWRAGRKNGQKVHDFAAILVNFEKVWGAWPPGSLSYGPARLTFDLSLEVA